jgi:hypothetical protein
MFVSRTSLAGLVLSTSLFVFALGQPGSGAPAGDNGVRRHEEGAFTGYTLVTPLRSTRTHLVDMQGEVVHTWESAYPPGNSVYLQDDGTLLRSAREPRGEIFEGGGIGGRIQRLAWDGTVLWDFPYANEQVWHHHDFEPLPNGNVLLIAWERKTRDEVLAKGRDPALVQDGGLWPDHVVEVKPVGKTSGEIVWSWHIWDHLIQDLDPEKEGYGDPRRQLGPRRRQRDPRCRPGAPGSPRLPCASRSSRGPTSPGSWS